MVVEGVIHSVVIHQLAADGVKDCVVCSVSVGAQVESGVMQLIVEHATVAMTTQSDDNHVTTWAAKVFANAANNGKSVLGQLEKRPLPGLTYATVIGSVVLICLRKYTKSALQDLCLRMLFD